MESNQVTNALTFQAIPAEPSQKRISFQGSLNTVMSAIKEIIGKKSERIDLSVSLSTRYDLNRLLAFLNVVADCLPKDLVQELAEDRIKKYGKQEVNSVDKSQQRLLETAGSNSFSELELEVIRLALNEYGQHIKWEAERFPAGDHLPPVPANNRFVLNVINKLLGQLGNGFALVVKEPIVDVRSLEYKDKPREHKMTVVETDVPSDFDAMPCMNSKGDSINGVQEAGK